MSNDICEKDRAVLLSYFKTGEIPTESHFDHLIDSFLNKVDDDVRVDFETKSICIGEREQINRLNVHGSAAIGKNYTNTQCTPENGLIVEGNVAIDTDAIEPREGEGSTLTVAGIIKSNVGFRCPDGSLITTVQELDNWSKHGSNIFYKNGNVAIGTDHGDSALTVAGIIESYEGFKCPDGSTIKSFEGLGTWMEVDEEILTTEKNVGIGVSEPLSALHVEGNVTLSKGSSESGIDFNRHISHAPGASISYLHKHEDSGNNHDAGDLIFLSRESGVGNQLTESMRITGIGNIGIGTTTPGSKLTVDGMIETTDGFRFPDGTVQTTAHGSSNGNYWQEAATDDSIHYDLGNVGIGTIDPTAQLSLGSNNAGSAGPVNGPQLLLSGKRNEGANKGQNGDAFKLVIEGYDNNGSTVYPIYLKDENQNVDFWIRNRPKRTGLPRMYFAGNVEIAGHIKIEPWVEPELTDVENIGSPYATAGYHKDVQGRVFMKGRVEAREDLHHLFTINKEHRPNGACTFVVASSVGPLTIEVRSNGHVHVTEGIEKGEGISLDGISFSTLPQN